MATIGSWPVDEETHTKQERQIARFDLGFKTSP